MIDERFILRSILHHFGPAGLKQVLDSLPEAEATIVGTAEGWQPRIGDAGVTAEGVEYVVVPVERSVVHHKRGSSYSVLGEASAQVSMRGRGPLRDNDKLVVYRAHSDGTLWVRYPNEFNDGRFGPMTSPAALTPSGRGGQHE